MDLYYMPRSAPCRAVIMTANALDIKLNKKLVNIRKGEHVKADYLKLNPQHTIPTLVDGDLVINESRVILIYLCENYDTKHQWYPECPQKQALINARLFFDLGSFYQSFAEYYYPLIATKSAPKQKFGNIIKAFRVFNGFMAGQLYAAGNCATIADIALATTMINFDKAGFDYSPYENVTKWYENCKNILPGFAENYDICTNFKSYLKSEANL